MSCHCEKISFNAPIIQNFLSPFPRIGTKPLRECFSFPGAWVLQVVWARGRIRRAEVPCRAGCRAGACSAVPQCAGSDVQW